MKIGLHDPEGIVPQTHRVPDFVNYRIAQDLL